MQCSVWEKLPASFGKAGTSGRSRSRTVPSGDKTGAKDSSTAPEGHSADSNRTRGGNAVKQDEKIKQEQQEEAGPSARLETLLAASAQGPSRATAEAGLQILQAAAQHLQSTWGKIHSLART